MGKHAAPERAPTLGEVAVVLRDLKDRGVTFGSLLWVAKEQVWWDDPDAEATPHLPRGYASMATSDPRG